MRKRRIQGGFVKGLTPMLVLAVIGDGELYGYEIVQTIKEQSRDAFAPSEGSLYPILHRLELEGHLLATWRESDKGPRRRYYRLTSKGQGLLAESRAEWASLVKAVSGVTAGAS